MNIKNKEVNMNKKDLRIFKNIPDLHTKRLLLRKIRISDCDDVFEYASDPEVSKYLLWSAHCTWFYTRDYLFNINLMYSKCRFYDWGIEYCGKMIGTVGFTSFDFNNNSAEIGYVLNRRFWHNGIASEAVRRIIVFAFEELHLDKLVAKYMLENQASLRVAKAVGMIEVVGKKENIFFKETSIDIGTVELTKEAYLNNKRNF